MLPKSIICPRCDKPGFLTLRWVLSNHYCQIEIPHRKLRFVKKEIINLLARKGEEPTKLVDRWLVTYGPFWHLYIGHYDAEKYKKAMEEYKRSRRKSRPNGRQWHKVRYNRVKGQSQSDLEVLMAKYNFDLQDLRNEEKEKRTDFLLRRDIFDISLL